MLLSKYFLPTLKDNPAEAKVISHILMLRAGMIRQLTSGIYEWLPLGLRVLKKVEQIIREEMNHIGGNEMLAPCMQPLNLWKKSGRYGQMGGEMLKIKDRHGNDITFSPSAEEVMAQLFGENVQSYKQLPQLLYQIQWKFRDEIRPRFGVMRGREFFMKDAYCFDIDQESALVNYSNIVQAYLKIFNRIGLTAIPVFADTGSMGGNYSHEFHVLADTGESTIFYEKELETYIEGEVFDLDEFAKFYAMEEEKHLNSPTHEGKNIVSKKGIEVGHVFYYGDKYTQSMNIKIQDRNGKLVHPVSGAYGLGVSRVVAAIIENSHDENGIIWPESVAPFDIGVINLDPKDQECCSVSSKLYHKLKENGKEVLLDDMRDSTGTKFNRMDLIGIPHTIVVGSKGLKNNIVEIKNRKTQERQECSINQALEHLCVK